MAGRKDGDEKKNAQEARARGKEGNRREEGMAQRLSDWEEEGGALPDPTPRARRTGERPPR
ncbi:hypothetical protein [Streptomyces sp. UNOC14_S4]|uniref:hypothetical protein n=1 Tax=Streptomyces sp. UNOC14_S4 TaxID=2872340 RepID=UPI001E5F72F3|nr:hypothetical protein [Streptomyces sp. UNOC14_S4]MCC3771425.1 hypothetical protein [Streptomyces sp. UNOC14_S4]